MDWCVTDHVWTMTSSVFRTTLQACIVGYLLTIVMTFTVSIKKHYHSYLYWIISVAVKRYILSVYIPSVMYKAGSFGWAFLGCIWFILNLPRLCLYLQSVQWHWYIRLAWWKTVRGRTILLLQKHFCTMIV